MKSNIYIYAPNFMFETPSDIVKTIAHQEICKSKF